MRIIENKNKETVEIVRKQIKENDGYCLCSSDKNEDTKCMCKDFRESTSLGFLSLQIIRKS